MEVTKENFSLVLPSIEEELGKCEFYTFDLEMTGINLPPDQQKQGSHDPNKPGSFLTAPVDDCIYQNKDMAARKFSIIQLGLSLFTKVKEEPVGDGGDDGAGDEEVSTGNGDADELAAHVDAMKLDDDSKGGKKSKTAGGGNKRQYFGPDSGCPAINVGCKVPDTKSTYTAKSFNFYLFPAYAAGVMGAGCTKQITLDAETVGGFLSEHGMDFTKWISKGIPFVTAEEAVKIREKGNGSIDDFADLAARDAHFKGFLKRAEVLAASRKKSDNFDFPFFPSAGTLQAAQRALKMLGLKRVVSEGNGADKGKKHYGVQVDPNYSPGGAKSSSERALGAYRLYEMLVKSKKPLVAHNCLSDLLFLYHTFHSTPPKDYADFKVKMNKDFPIIFDTRTLCTLPQVGFDIDCVGNLGGQYRYFTSRCSKFLAFTHQLGFDHFHPQMLQSNSRGAHEAAYDAYMTGCLFLAMQMKLSGVLNFDAKVMQYANHIAVFGSVITCRLGSKAPADVILNSAPILWLQYPKGTPSCSFRQVDSCFNRNDLRGRMMTQIGGMAIFCGYNSGANSCRLGPANLMEFDEQLTTARKYLEKAIPGCKLGVLCDPTGLVKEGHADFPGVV